MIVGAYEWDFFHLRLLLPVSHTLSADTQDYFMLAKYTIVYSFKHKKSKLKEDNEYDNNLTSVQTLCYFVTLPEYSVNRNAVLQTTFIINFRQEVATS